MSVVMPSFSDRPSHKGYPAPQSEILGISKLKDGIYRIETLCETLGWPVDNAGLKSAGRRLERYIGGPGALGIWISKRRTNRGARYNLSRKGRS